MPDTSDLVDRLKKSLERMAADGYLKLDESKTAKKLRDVAEEIPDFDADAYLEDLKRRAEVNWAKKVLKEEEKWGRIGKSKRWGTAVSLLFYYEEMSEEELFSMIEQSGDVDKAFFQFIHGIDEFSRMRGEKGVGRRKQNEEIIAHFKDIVVKMVEKYNLSPKALFSIDIIVVDPKGKLRIDEAVSRVLLKKLPVIRSVDELLQLTEDQIYLRELSEVYPHYMSRYLSVFVRKEYGREYSAGLMRSSEGERIAIFPPEISGIKTRKLLRGSLIYKEMPWKAFVLDEYGGIEETIPLGKSPSQEEEYAVAKKLPIAEKLESRLRKFLEEGREQLATKVLHQISKISPLLAREVAERYGLKAPSAPLGEVKRLMELARDSLASEEAMKMILRRIDPQIAKKAKGIIGPADRDRIAEMLEGIDPDLSRTFLEWWRRLANPNSRRVISYKEEGKPDVVVVWDTGLKCSKGNEFYVPELNGVTAQLRPGDVTPAEIVSEEWRRGPYGKYKLIKVRPLSILGNVNEGFELDSYSGDIILPRSLERKRRKKRKSENEPNLRLQ